MTKKSDSSSRMSDKRQKPKKKEVWKRVKPKIIRFGHGLLNLAHKLYRGQDSK